MSHAAEARTRERLCQAGFLCGFVLMLGATPGWGQPITDGALETVISDHGMTQPLFANGDGVPVQSDLDKAKVICDRHLVVIDSIEQESIDNDNYIIHGTYKSGWQSCNLIMNKWSKSESAKEAKALQDQEDKDQAFVEKVARQP